jgi:uncharacterized protein (DUF2236 family)
MRHSDYRQDPWKRLAGTARWLVVSTFGSDELAEREASRVRRLHTVVRGTADDGRAYAASDPALLRWVHLAFTDAFLAAHVALGRDLTGRFGLRWPDAYVKDWERSARALGAEDLPTSRTELAEALRAYVPDLEPVPQHLRTFLSAPPGLAPPEQAFYAGLAAGAGLLVSPTLAPFAGVPGRDRRDVVARARLQATRLQLRGPPGRAGAGEPVGGGGPLAPGLRAPTGLGTRGRRLRRRPRPGRSRPSTAPRSLEDAAAATGQSRPSTTRMSRTAPSPRACSASW